MTRRRNSIGPIIGYHGCDRVVAEKVLSGQSDLKQSKNDYDWLGHGVYFWVDSPERAWDWATEQSERNRFKSPYIIGAYLFPGLCLNLTDYGIGDELRDAYGVLENVCAEAGKPVPENKMIRGGLPIRRYRDCAVIETLHQLRKDDDLPAYESVLGVFEEGGSLYEGSGFKEKTHIQIAICDPHCIVGYFRVPSARLEDDSLHTVRKKKSSAPP